MRPRASTHWWDAWPGWIVKFDDRSSDGFAQKIEQLNLCSIYAGVSTQARNLIKSSGSFINPEVSANRGIFLKFWQFIPNSGGSNLLNNKQLCFEDEKEAFTVGSVIIKSKQKIQVIKPSKEPGNNWAIELGMTNPRPLEQSLRQRWTKSSQTFLWPNNRRNPFQAHQRKTHVSTLQVLLFNLLVGVCNPAFLLLSGSQHAAISHWARLWWCWASLHQGFTLGAAPLSRWALGAGAASATTPPSLLLLSSWGRTNRAQPIFVGTTNKRINV